MKKVGGVLPFSDLGKVELCRSALKGDTRFVCTLSAAEKDLIRSALRSAIGYVPAETMQGRVCDLEDVL